MSTRAELGENKIRKRRKGRYTDVWGEMIRSEAWRRWCYLSGDEDFSEFTDMSGAC